MSAKTLEVLEYNGTKHHAWYVQCPACGTPHSFDTRWTFNGDHDRPTFRASMLVRWKKGDADHVCHSFLTDGVWEYLADCTHAMKGQKVPAPDWPGYVRGTMAETPTAAKAEADAKKATDELAARREADAKRDADKRDADKVDVDAKARAKAEADAKKAASAKADAAEDAKKAPAAEETATVRNTRDASERRAAMQRYRARGERIYTALRSSDVGLDEAAAAILTVHLLETVEGGEHMGATEVIAWVKTFQHQNPVAWPAIRNAHLPQFQAAMQRCNVRTLPSEELDARAAAVRMPKSLA